VLYVFYLFDPIGPAFLAVIYRKCMGKQQELQLWCHRRRGYYGARCQLLCMEPFAEKGSNGMASAGRTTNTPRKRVIRKEPQTGSGSLVGGRAEGYFGAVCWLRWRKGRALAVSRTMGSCSAWQLQCAMDDRQTQKFRGPSDVFVRTPSFDEPVGIGDLDSHGRGFTGGAVYGLFSRRM